MLNQFPGPQEVDSYSAVGDTTPSTSCVSCTHTQGLLDSIGRLASGNLVNNPANEVSVNFGYDGLNRVISTTHPHIGMRDPNNVSETAYYDGLGRVVQTQHPDGQVVRSAYGTNVGSLGGLTTQQSSTTTYGSGFPVVSVDEAGKQTQEWIDGFGNVIEVDEPSSNTGALATAAITISGSAGGTTGSITITVNGFAATANWCPSSNAASVAASLAGAFSSPLSPVTATVNGAVVTMTAVGTPLLFSELHQDEFSSDACFRNIHRRNGRINILSIRNGLHL
jgi:YD repeat-containing protein